MLIRHPSLAERVYQRLLSQIISGARHAGDKLSEEAICAEFGISRTPAREALLLLTREGLVERLPRRGCFVKACDHEDVAELFECRRLLECQALELGFERIPPQKLDVIESLLDESDPDRQRQTSLQADDKLHALIADACPNRHLAEFVRQLQTRTRPFRSLRTLDTRDIALISRERRQIATAIREHRKADAIRLLGIHIQQGQAQFAEG
jgi:DNA-binding GntR family transcriptional regulator